MTHESPTGEEQSRPLIDEEGSHITEWPIDKSSHIIPLANFRSVIINDDDSDLVQCHCEHDKNDLYFLTHDDN